MLRSLDEQGGIGIYTRYITEALLSLDSGHEFVLMHRNAAHRGRYAGRSRVSERLVRVIGGKAGWDQLAIPVACRREKIDVLFHPKFTVPFMAPCPVVMTVHGADWFIPEDGHLVQRCQARRLKLDSFTTTFSLQVT